MLKGIKFFEEKGINYKVVYDIKQQVHIKLKKFKPDIVFYQQPWLIPDNQNPFNTSKNALICYVPYCYYSLNSYMNYLLGFHGKLWKYFVESDLHKEEYQQKFNAKNCTAIGSCKLDSYKTLDKSKIDTIWKTNKKRIIYSPHNCFEQENIDYATATFDKNGEFILQLAKSHPEYEWIFRPHPVFKDRVLRHKIKTLSEIENYFEEWKKIGTIYTGGDYYEMFAGSDYLITDCISFLSEYLPTAKPVIHLRKDEQIQKLLERLRDLATQASNETYDADAREAMQAEADEILEQIEQIRNVTSYNGKNLFEIEQNSNTPVSRLSSSVRSSYPLALMSSRVMSISDEDTVSGAFDFSSGETKTVTIDGVSYTVTNNASVSASLSYTKDKSTGVLTISANKMTIKGQADVAHNLVINGSSNTVYGGDKNDSLALANANNVNNKLYGGAGDDTFTSVVSDSYNSFYGGDGDDTFNVYGNTGVFAEAGNDVINLNYNISSSSNVSSYGGDGDDTFNINGNNWYCYGNSGEDTFNIKSGVQNTFVDGGGGTNAINDHGTNTIKINVPNANAYSEFFVAGETKIITVNGKEYTITNTASNDNKNLVYSIKGDTIEFQGTYFKITGNSEQSHNVKLLSQRMTFTGGNLNDTIIVANTARYAAVYGGSGDDYIENNAADVYMWGQDGNDKIINNGANSCLIFGGNGDDTVEITKGTGHYLDAGDGNDNVTVLGSASNATIYGGAGKNTITNKSGNNIGISGFGDADNCSAIVINPSASKTVTINGVSYSLVNQSCDRTSVVLYNYNSVSGETSFWGSYVDVHGKTDNIAYNVVVSGAYNNCYGGELDDKLTAKGWVVSLHGKSGNDTLIQNSYWAKTYGGKGDDTIIANKNGSYIYGEAGNDTITINVETSNEIDGGTGDDTYNINASCAPKDTDGNNVYNIDADNCNITGGMGNDTFYVNGNNNTVNGAGGDDYFVINSKGSNTIDGATGDNYYVDNSDGNATLVNVVSDPNSGMLQFSSIGEEKSFIIDGKKYTVKNSTTLGTSQAANSLKYSYNATTGKITVDGSNFTITSDDSACNLAVKGDNNLVYGSKYADTIIVESGSNNKIYGLNGDDNLILNSADNSVLGGDGNDTITVNAASGKEINGEDGNDIININCNNNSNIIAGDGNDRLNING